METYIASDPNLKKSIQTKTYQKISINNDQYIIFKFV